MKKMSTNEIALIAVALGGVFFLFGDKLLMKLESWKQVIRDGVEEQMPLDVEIERARRRTADLLNQILKQREIVVKQSIDVDNLRNEIVKAEKQQAQQKKDLLALRSSLSKSEIHLATVAPDGDPQVVEVQALESAFDNYQIAEATLGARKEVLRIRNQTLLEAQKQLHAVEETRKQLQLQVENLVARLELVRAKSGTGVASVDRESFALSASQLRRLDDRLKFMEGMLDQDRTIDASMLQISDTAEDDIRNEVDQYFGLPSKD